MPLLVVVLVLLASLVTQGELERILALPATPGSVALLGEHAWDVRAQERLGAALAEESAETRAAAARVVRAAGLSRLGGAVVEALAGEDDRGAAIELMYAAASLTREDDSILDAAGRLGLVQTAALALGASRGAAAIAHLERLRDMDADLPLVDFLRLASRGRHEMLGALVPRAFREGDERLWSAYLAIARERAVAVERGQILYAATDRRFREAALWHLVLLNGLDAELLDEARSRTQAAEGELSVESSFLLELLGRREGREAGDHEGWIAARAAGESTRLGAHDVLSWPSVVLLLLTERERRALSEQVRGDDEALDGAFEQARAAGAGAEGVERRPHGSPMVSIPASASVQTVSRFPSGMVADLLDVTGCRPRELIGYSGATIRFTTDGRPRSVDFDAAVEDERCDRLAKSLLLASVLPVRSLSALAQRSRLLVLVGPDQLSCLARAHPYEGESRPSGHVQPPKRTKDVSPEYPESALAERVQGIVILQAVIEPTGCVTEMRVLRSPDDRLTVESFLAVSQWGFEPATADGAPVTMIGTVTVVFSL